MVREKEKSSNLSRRLRFKMPKIECNEKLFLMLKEKNTFMMLTVGENLIIVNHHLLFADIESRLRWDGFKQYIILIKIKFNVFFKRKIYILRITHRKFQDII